MKTNGFILDQHLSMNFFCLLRQRLWFPISTTQYRCNLSRSIRFLWQHVQGFSSFDGICLRNDSSCRILYTFTSCLVTFTAIVAILDHFASWAIRVRFLPAFLTWRFLSSPAIFGFLSICYLVYSFVFWSLVHEFNLWRRCFIRPTYVNTF